MIKIDKDLAIALITKDIDKGASFGKVGDKLVNIYEREYKNKHYTIVEYDDLDEFYVVTSKDVVREDTDSDWNKALNGLKEALTDIEDTLKDTK